MKNSNVWDSIYVEIIWRMVVLTNGRNFGKLFKNKSSLYLLTYNMLLFQNRHNNSFFHLRWEMFLWQPKVLNIFKQRCEFCGTSVNYSSGCTVKSERLRGSEEVNRFQNFYLRNIRQQKNVTVQQTMLIATVELP